MADSKRRRYFQQFPFWTALRLWTADRMRRLLDRHGAPGYGQMGEDRILASLLPREPGYYVDVGANDPCRFSNTFSLYKRGWHGLTIDANPDLVAQHARIRPRDEAVCAAVADAEVDVEFTEFEDDAYSSLDPETVAEWSKHTKVAKRRTVRTQLLTKLLEAHAAPPRFELLSIDVEGHDLAALRGLDLDRFRPGVVVIEIHDLDLDRASDSEIHAHLTAHGYAFVGYAVSNAYFRDTREGASG